MSIQLPPGSSHSLDLLEQLGRRKLARISKKILESLSSDKVFSDEEIQKLSTSGVEINSAEVNLIINILIVIWRHIAYHQLKVDKIKEELEQLNLKDDTVTTFLDVWQELGQSVSDNLRNVSRSGVPELLGTEWYLKLERANRFESVKREPKVQIKLKTDQGNKYEEFNFEQLKALHYTLQEIQDKLRKCRNLNVDPPIN